MMIRSDVEWGDRIAAENRALRHANARLHDAIWIIAFVAFVCGVLAAVIGLTIIAP